MSISTEEYLHYCYSDGIKETDRKKVVEGGKRMSRNDLQTKLDTIRLLASSLKVPEKEQDGYLWWEDSYSPARLERQLVELRALALDALKIQKNLKY